MGQTVHALGGYGECLFWEFMLNCSSFNAEAKAQVATGKTIAES